MLYSLNSYASTSTSMYFMINYNFLSRPGVGSGAASRASAPAAPAAGAAATTRSDDDSRNVKNRSILCLSY